MTASWLGRQHKFLTFRLGARVMRWRACLGADGRDMNEPRTHRGGRLRHCRGAFRLYGVETLSASLEQDADQIDNHVAVARRRFDRVREAYIGLHRFDLPDRSQRLQIAGQLRAAHRDANTVVPVGERAHHMAAEESGAAEHGDQRVKIALHSHCWRNTGSISGCTEAKHARLTRG